METLGDLRQAVRSFARRPLFTSVLLLTLALGIGSNVAIFSVANTVLFRPLPYESPEELGLVWTRLPATNVARTLVSGPDFADYRTGTSLFDGFAGAMALRGTLTGDGAPEEVMTGWTTENLFRILGVKPALGRDFNPDDAFPIDPELFGDPNANLPPGAVMLGHAFWERRFGSDPTILGRTILLDGWGAVVVGVLPRDFRIHLPADAGMPTNVEAWRVLPENFSDFARDSPWLTVVTRLKDGVALEQAQLELDAVAARLRDAHQFHANQNMQIVLNGMHRDVVSHARPALLALLGSVGFVLLIACGNVANLLLVRGSEREREIAVRAAIGGGRGRIVRQMLTESAVLAAGGAVLGVVLAWWGVRAITALSPGNLPRIDEVGIDGPVLAFTAGLTAFSALVFGLAPALRAVAGNLADFLRDRGSHSGGVRGNRLRTALVVTEVALSLVLLIGAGLMLRSFAELRRVDPGFEPENVVTFSAPLQFMKYATPSARSNFMNELGVRLSGLPGVERVGGVTPLPLAGGEQYSVGSYGRVGAAEEAYLANKADFKAVLPGYFEALGIEVLSGRSLELADNDPNALEVAVVDEKLAERLFEGDDPLDKEILLDHFNEETFSMERRPRRIVGVVENVRSTSLAAEARETVYLPYVLFPWLPLTYVVRTRSDPAGLVPLIRREVESIDPDVPVSSVGTMESHVSRAMAPTRFFLALVGTFAAVALVLASLGLYGVISYSVRQRTREIGVRVAFGARDVDVLRLVLGQGLGLALGGVAIGLAVALALTRVVESLLVGVSSTDPLTFAGIPTFLVVVAAVAVYVPARRAMRVDPVEALRDD